MRCHDTLSAELPCIPNNSSPLASPFSLQPILHLDPGFIEMKLMQMRTPHHEPLLITLPYPVLLPLVDHQSSTTTSPFLLNSEATPNLRRHVANHGTQAFILEPSYCIYSHLQYSEHKGGWAFGVDILVGEDLIVNDYIVSRACGSLERCLSLKMACQ